MVPCLPFWRINSSFFNYIRANTDRGCYTTEAVNSLRRLCSDVFARCPSCPPAGCCTAAPSAYSSTSYCAPTSRHTLLLPLVQLIVVTALLSPLPSNVSITISAAVAIIGGGREYSLSLLMSASLSSSFVIITIICSLSALPWQQLQQTFPSSSSSTAAKHCHWWQL